jgi:shikimate dehydrogenase
MKNLLSGKTKVAGVFGWPVEHSLSPKLHGYWLQKYNVDGVYVPFPTHPDNFEQALRALPTLGIVGCNITVPHKINACSIVDTISEAAKIIGAVNTVVVGKDGSLNGSNTDAFGFIENIRSTDASWNCNGKAVVLGAGGAARAVCYGLLDAGAKEVLLLNRTTEKAEQIASDLQVKGNVFVHDWDKRSEVLAGASLLVNTTILGMGGKPELEISLDDLPKEAIVTDIVYTPLETPLLKQAKDNGNQTVDGLGMLLHQARAGFRDWFGKDPEVTEELRQLLIS